jgi:putative nucleotidyltransferase with HDIG domain
MKPSLRWTAAAALGVVLHSGCALFRGRPEPYPSGLVFPLMQDGQVSFAGEIAGGLQRTPSGIVLAAKPGVIYAVDETKRKILWSYKAGEPVESAPVVGPDALTVVDRASGIHRLTFAGDLVWKSKPRGRIATPVREADGTLYFGTEGNALVALSVADGSELWRTPLASELTAGPLPVGDLILAGCKDGSIRGIQRSGRAGWAFAGPSAATSFVLADEGRLYYAAEDGLLRAVDIGGRKARWKVRTNGPVRGAALVAGKRLLFLTANNVLYCLDKGGGDILWWQPLPARPRFDPILAGERVVVATQSQVVAAYDLKTGAKTGEYAQEAESRSNPVWADPFLVSTLYDEDKQEGRLVFLKKDVRVDFLPTIPSPQKEGEEVTFTAQAIGFFKPLYEFRLKSGESEELVQEASEKNQWTWYDAKAGTYTIIVKAADEKVSAEGRVSYVIDKPAKPEAEKAADAGGSAKPPESPKGESKMTRNEALELVKSNLPNQNLVKHCLSVEACMKAVAVRLGQDPEPWGMAGLLHDLDYERTAKSPELHTTETVKMLEGKGLPAPVLHAIQAHAGKVPCESAMDWAIYSIDPLTGLIIAATLMHPDKKLASIDLEFIKRRYKEKSFAKGAKREEIEKCVNAGLELDEFISICIKAMQGISADLGL